jgi:hypothetical protein
METSTPLWYNTGKTTVWSHTQLGEILIADCTSKVLTVSAQRLNTRIITIAPEMMELLNEINYLEPDHLNRYTRMYNSVYASQGD